ncbi:uncharacterized protein RHO25_005343 [Cercospora beticola]|uniref:Mitochondrial import receptor subunit tom22 n=1 Tax=Cercospora beticola TaxID=122368 RepID=A0ABZ0NMF2_CERBT|nr:hypothetical protein RHO25_005343 [Cercospora beticola]
MFGGQSALEFDREEYETDEFPIAPPQPTPEELAQQEAAARQTIFGMVSMCVVLYFSPFAVDAVKNLI